MTSAVTETVAQQVARAMVERAARGEPEPGIYVCARCGRDDCRMYTVVLSEREDREAMGGLNQLNRFDASAWTQRLKGVLICPCCSFEGCPHPAWDPSCRGCGRPIAPEGKWATRCPVDGVHS